MSVIVSLWLLIFGRDVGHCQHCQLQSLHGVCFGCSVFSQTDSKVFCIRLPATSMSGGCGQGSFWPNFAPKKEDDKSEADDMAVATQKSEELFENAEGQSENETPEVEEPEGEETPEVENKKPPRNSKKGAELLNAKPKAASSKAKAKAKAKAASSKMKAAPKKRVDPKRKAKAAPKRKRNQVKRPAAVDDLEASSEHEKAVDAESSEEIQEISGYRSDATATTLPLTPRAGTLQSERDSNKPKGRKPKDPKVEVDKSSGCSKCRWSKRGCAKCRGQATK